MCHASAVIRGQLCPHQSPQSIEAGQKPVGAGAQQAAGRAVLRPVCPSPPHCGPRRPFTVKHPVEWTARSELMLSWGPGPANTNTPRQLPRSSSPILPQLLPNPVPQAHPLPTMAPVLAHRSTQVRLSLGPPWCPSPRVSGQHPAGPGVPASVPTQGDQLHQGRPICRQ